MTTVRELTTGALRLINVISTNEEPSADDINISREALNALISSKGNLLLNIHTITPYRFSLVPGQQNYILGPATDDAGNATGADWITERPMRIEQANLMLYSDFLDFTGTPDEGIFPLTVQFAPTFIVSGAYSWDFGDGSTSTLTSPTHTYTTVGTYDVKLFINGILQVEKTAYITVRTPTVTVTANPTTGFVPLSVDFTVELT